MYLQRHPVERYHRMMDADRLSGALLFVFSLYIVYEALKLPLGGVHQPDSGFFPISIAFTLVFLSGLIVLGTFRREHVREPVQFGERKRGVIVTVVALILYVVALDRLGYMVSTLLIMVLLMKGVEQLRWRDTLWVALPTVVASYFVFRWLGVPLPPGIIPL